jgi:hypothetical protein
MANRAQTVSFFISISYTSMIVKTNEGFGSPDPDDTITSVFSFFKGFPQIR